MLAVLDRPADQSRRPLIVLIHGLTGCQDSDYILNSARFWLDREHPVLRLNLRGAGPSRSHCTEQYHAGRSDDLRFVLAALDDAILAHGAIAIGYSLGGNLLLKYLGEEGALAPFLAAASVSAPIDLAAAAQRFNRPRNWHYQRWLLAMMILFENPSDQRLYIVFRIRVNSAIIVPAIPIYTNHRCGAIDIRQAESNTGKNGKQGRCYENERMKLTPKR